ncbi:hypothetical protein CROQUDRAFT_717099 [Cronartium quercuum f. sp. fusiforme G11]|uniref:DUF7872 domain-containing protein n=1 Tax=Cronartium quercuum f. sp. fusiforme G11 TaxID=708437 RepID=A0A9P6NCJ3_9BASI|nr:hypothetical protein CROQUDRAFT_717099 [Cronartium quercuum f. sp. fusiforme G11]
MSQIKLSKSIRVISIIIIICLISLNVVSAGENTDEDIGTDIKPNEPTKTTPESIEVKNESESTDSKNTLDPSSDNGSTDAKTTGKGTGSKTPEPEKESSTTEPATAKENEPSTDTKTTDPETKSKTPESEKESSITEPTSTKEVESSSDTKTNDKGTESTTLESEKESLQLSSADSSEKESKNLTTSKSSASGLDLESDPCGKSGTFNLTPEFWQEQKVDEYMESKIELKNMTITQYAASLGMPNFLPGIGFPALAGQMCYPAVGKDYLIIYSIEKWNTFMNTLYTSVESTTLMLMDLSAGIVVDFIPPGGGVDKEIMGYGIATIVCAIVGFATGPLAPIAYAAGLGGLMAKHVTDTAKMGAAVVQGTKAQRQAYVAARQASQAGNMAKVNAAMKAGDTNQLKSMVYGGKNLVANSEKFPLFKVNPGKMAKINKMLGYSANTRRPKEVKQAHKAGIQAAKLSEKTEEAGKASKASEQVGTASKSTKATDEGAQAAEGAEKASKRKRTRRTLVELTDSKSKRDLQKRDHKFEKRGIPNVYTYTKWSFLCTHIANLRNQLQQFVTMSVSLTLEAPIWSQQGIAPQIQGGAMLIPNPSWGELEIRHKRLGIIAILSELFVALEMIGLIGAEHCDGESVTEFQGDSGPLNECDEKGVSWSIVNVKPEGQYEKVIHNARFLKKKYNYGTKDLVKRAWDCQRKYGPYGNNT